MDPERMDDRRAPALANFAVPDAQCDRAVWAATGRPSNVGAARRPGRQAKGRCGDCVSSCEALGLLQCSAGRCAKVATMLLRGEKG